MSFILSKLLWAVSAPGSLLSFLLAGGLGLTLWSKAARLGKTLCWIVAGLLLLITVFPVGDWALAPIENRAAAKLPDVVDGIIIIGGDENTHVTEARGMPVALDSMRRYARFAELARQYPHAKLVFSGGSGHVMPRSALLDSEVAHQFLLGMGVEDARLIFERKSRNTYENARFSAEIVKPEATQNWVLVTSAWHMPRAIGCFRAAGWNIYPAPAGYFTTGRFGFYTVWGFSEQMRNLTMAAHEYIGLISYRLMGRIPSIWPQ